MGAMRFVFSGSGSRAAACLVAAVIAVAAWGCKDSGGGPACTPGSSGCECKADGTCDAGLDCVDKVCTEPGCPAGTLSCPCKGDGTCDAGLVCEADKCATPAGAGLVVGNVAARACDVVFQAAGAKVQFTKDVKGVTAVRGDRIALSFTATADAAFTGAVASITGSDGKALSGLAPEKAECYDRLGKAIDAPDVKVQ